MLDCSLVFTEPCRGFTGDCSDLPLQFKDVPGSGPQRESPSPRSPGAPR